MQRAGRIWAVQRAAAQLRSCPRAAPQEVFAASREARVLYSTGDTEVLSLEDTARDHQMASARTGDTAQLRSSACTQHRVFSLSLKHSTAPALAPLLPLEHTCKRPAGKGHPIEHALRPSTVVGHEEHTLQSVLSASSLVPCMHVLISYPCLDTLLQVLIPEHAYTQ
jgi:hypothetical protein